LARLLLLSGRKLSRDENKALPALGGTGLGILLGEVGTGCHHPGFMASHPFSSTRLCTGLGHLPTHNSSSSTAPLKVQTCKGVTKALGGTARHWGPSASSRAYPELEAKKVLS